MKKENKKYRIVKISAIVIIAIATLLITSTAVSAADVSDVDNVVSMQKKIVEDSRLPGLLPQMSYLFHYDVGDPQQFVDDRIVTMSGGTAVVTSRNRLDVSCTPLAALVLDDASSESSIKQTGRMQGDIIYVPEDYPTIQQAINAAEDGDEVVVAEGTYLESVIFWAKAITVRSTDPEDPDIVASTIIHADLGRAVEFAPEAGSDTILTGFTITDGHDYYGGGVYMWNTSPTIANCIFTANSAIYDGGAIYIGTDSSPKVANCTFTNNVADNSGGAMRIKSGSPTINACTFYNNSAMGGGGAVSSRDNHNVTMINCLFTENSAEAGGAFCESGGSSMIRGCFFDQNSATWLGGAVYSYNSILTMFDCTFQRNDAEFQGGGMVIMSLADGAIVTGCTFTSNTANDFGGGLLGCAGVLTVKNCEFSTNWAERGGGMACLYPDFIRDTWVPWESSDLPGYVALESANTYPVLVDACTFIDNTAVWGAGLYHDAIWSEPPAVTRCVFLANRADADGGGMVCRHITDASLSGCTFVANTAAGNGGGLCNTDNWGISNYEISNCIFSGNDAGGNGDGLYNNRSDVTVTNCILWGDMGEEIYNFQSSPVVTYCDVQGGYEGEGNIDADPLFVDPNSGNYRISYGSPCIDAGNNYAVPEDVTTDLDGNPRFVDDPATEDTGHGVPPIVDMGAYEFQVGDINGDGKVNTEDLLMLLAAWGNNGGPEDINGDGIVNVEDLLLLLANWG